jgi:hypothetical protein
LSARRAVARSCLALLLSAAWAAGPAWSASPPKTPTAGSTLTRPAPQPAEEPAPPPAAETPPVDDGTDGQSPPETRSDDAAKPQSLAFAGGTLTIAQNEDDEKILSFDGQELYRNYVGFFDRVVQLGDTQVALFSFGDGGNQCGPATIIVWKPEGKGIRTQPVGEACGAPLAAATDSSLYFVPFLLPGSSEAVQVWSPSEGLRQAGMLSFTPQPGTGWDKLDVAALDSIVDAFSNEAVYMAGRKLLGDRMTPFATGLLTGGGVETTGAGAFYGYGCVPHACGGSDAFMAIDAKGRKLYLAQQGERPHPDAWPPLKSWPADIRAAMQASIGANR